jgi:hypothetical protein
MNDDKMTWEEWYYKYYPRVARMITLALYLSIFSIFMVLFMAVGLALGWI